MQSEQQGFNAKAACVHVGWLQYVLPLWVESTQAHRVAAAPVSGIAIVVWGIYSMFRYLDLDHHTITDQIGSIGFPGCLCRCFGIEPGILVVGYGFLDPVACLLPMVFVLGILLTASGIHSTFGYLNTGAETLA